MALQEKAQVLLQKYNTHIQVLSTIVIVASSIGAITGLVAIYKNGIWKPTVVVNSVDFNSAVAQLTVNGNAVTLYGDDVVAAGGLWGVRFGTTGASTDKYDTLELVKNNMVYEVYKNN